MVGIVDPDRPVAGMEHALGTFYSGTRSLGDDPRGQVPVFHQVLDAGAYAVAFEPGSDAYKILSNDQKRFSPPRTLPPILGLELPEEEDNDTGGYVITRYAYSEGAYQLLADLLARGHVFGMNDFLEFAWSLATALAYLHEHGIVHGQWNDRSVIAIPTEERAHPFLETPSYRFEVIDTGVCFKTAASIPPEYLERGYYPAEVFVQPGGAPDYGALDLEGDVHCFAAFLRDLMQRACSTEELPSQATRILEELQKEANRRGWKASPDRLRDKELEILDHLYTVKVRSESAIQEGLRPRDERCSAARLLELVGDLHEKATSYLEELFARGFEPVNVFGDDLQHYTTFALTVSPQRVNSYEDGHVVLTGSGLPDDFVRITLDERHEGVRVLSARPGRIEFKVEHGFPTGRYRISVNNRRTNGSLEVYSPSWRSIDPVEVHQPWEGFGNIRLGVRGERLPVGAHYGLRPLDGDGEPDAEREIAAIVVETSEGVFEPPPGGPEPGARSEQDELDLTFPCDTPPAHYGLFANGLPTGLRAQVRSQLPDPAIRAGALEPAEIKNHRSWSLRLTGRSFHPRMVVDLGEETPEGLELRVDSPEEAELVVPERFPPGEYRLRLNYRPTDVGLTVVEPSWNAVRPASLKLLRGQEEPAAVEVEGRSLPALDGGERYSLVASNGEPIRDGVVDVEEVEPEAAHRLHLAPGLPRGRPRIRFGQIDTGLQLHVRRQLPRAAGLAAAAAVVLALVAIGLVLRQQLAPRITGVEPDTVYAFGSPRVEIAGAHLAAVELLGEDGAPVARLALDAVGEEAGRYLVAVGDLAEGEYRLRPVGALFGGAPSRHRLRVRSLGLTVEPKTLNRLRDNVLELGSTSGFDVTRLSSLRLLPAPGGGELAELPIEAGRVEVPSGRLPAGSEGTYRIAVDGAAPPEGLEIAVVGPRVAALTPNPATRAPDGTVSFAVEGSHLDADLWLGLLEEDAADDRSPHPLERTADGLLRATVEPGTYRLVLGPDVSALETVREPSLRVLPQPRISAVSPTKLEPGRETRVTVEGTNLAALEDIVIQPTDASLERVRVPLDPDKIVGTGELDGRYDFGVTLQSGSYRVEPSAGALKLEVFDDCREAVAAFRAGSDPEALLECLEKGRPRQDVLWAAAELLFDRGLFAAAGKLYRKGPQDLVGRFRANFVDAFVRQQPVSLLVLDARQRATPYGVAAVRLGWAGAGEAEWSADFVLPWELEFARGVTTADPATKVEAFRQSIEKKTAACRGFEIARFEPALERLAAARLELAVSLIRDLQAPRARLLLENDLIGDREVWERLDAADRARALFWHGHLLLWYAGDTAAATASFARAARMAAGPAPSWSRLYLDALGSEPPQEAPPAADEGSWQVSFLRVFRLYREVTESPNYNLLTERHGADVYLPADERERSVELHAHLGRLEKLEPVDPLAHYAVLHYLRNAQKIAWPEQDQEGKAAEFRARLLGLAVPEELDALQQFYVLLGDLGPYDAPQITVLQRSERKRHAQRADAVSKMALPEAFRKVAEELEQKFTGPSVVWWSTK